MSGSQDPELSAALGWPGGISDPVLDRTRLLQMVAALHLASKQALEALDEADTFHRNLPDQRARRLAAMAALRAALAESGRDWSLLEATQESLREHMAEIHRLRAAPAQQAEPDHETRAELAEQQVVQLAEERDHYRNLWQKAHLLETQHDHHAD